MSSNRERWKKYLPFTIGAAIPALVALFFTSVYDAGNPDTGLAMFILGPPLVLGSPAFLAMMYHGVSYSESLDLKTCVRIGFYMNILTNAVIMVRVPPIFLFALPASFISIIIFVALSSRIEQKHKENEERED